MSYFKAVRENEVPEEERMFTQYNDKRPMNVEETKMLFQEIATYIEYK